jgi:hypothetical protein
MTLRLVIRPVLVLAALAGLGACGMVEADPNRFETLANSVAAIPLDGPRPPAPPRPSREAQLRPALRVEVMDPHALWDARDGLQGAVERAAPQLAAAAAPALAEAIVQRVSERADGARASAGLRPAVVRAPVAPRPGAGLVQLGAYSSEASARSAWSRLKAGEAASALAGLTPVFEAVEVGGRTLTRLKVEAPRTGAAAVCAAARIDDPWCHRAA